MIKKSLYFMKFIEWWREKCKPGIFHKMMVRVVTEKKGIKN
jgi:hypothetical protein